MFQRVGSTVQGTHEGMNGNFDTKYLTLCIPYPFLRLRFSSTVSHAFTTVWVGNLTTCYPSSHVIAKMGTLPGNGWLAAHFGIADSLPKYRAIVKTMVSPDSSKAVYVGTAVFCIESKGWCSRSYFGVVGMLTCVLGSVP